MFYRLYRPLFDMAKNRAWAKNISNFFANHAGLVGAFGAVMLVPLGLLGAAILLLLLGAAICAASVRRLRVVF